MRRGRRHLLALLHVAERVPDLAQVVHADVEPTEKGTVTDRVSELCRPESRQKAERSRESAGGELINFIDERGFN